METASGTVIEHIRLRNAQTDVPVARLRLSYLLSSMDLRPAAMPPSAVLVVRSMRDPLPHRITPAFVSAAAPSRAWERAARSQMGDLYARAARPAIGPVPPSAESVVFSDYAELLACLALDMDTGTASSWWWRSVLRRFGSRSSGNWTDVWAEHPRYVPAALQHLDRQRSAVEMIERISAEQAWRLLLAVVREFAVADPLVSTIENHLRLEDPKPKTPFSSRAARAGTFVDISQESERHPTNSDRPALPPNGPATPPWESWILPASVPASLGTAQRALLGISLLLCRAPDAVSSRLFALRIQSWLASQQAVDNRAGPAQAPASLRDSPVKPDERAKVAAGEESLAARTSEFVPEDINGPGVPTLAAQVPLDTPAAVQAIDTIEVDPVSELLQPLLELRTGVRTGLGGIFYLIHLILQAELLHFETGLGGWALLDLLARCLLAQNFASYADDPVWTALAALDGREVGTLPGASFAPQKIYEAPSSWLPENKPSDPAKRIRFRSNRTEIWHSEGSPILDSEDPISTLPTGLLPLTRHERRQFKSAAQVHPLGLNLSPQLRRFLHFILPYARWRLRTALGNISPEQLMSRPGTLYISRTHLDIVMEMNQVSLPVRIAGLDANPGWVPHFGRVITFHFMQEGSGYA